MKPSFTSGLRWGLILGSLLLSFACAIDPITGRETLHIISDSEEVALGKMNVPQVEAQFGGLYPNRAVDDYVNLVGQKLARVSHRPNFPYTYKVVNSKVVNAFALPGGFIYITQGLLSKLETESELAAVLGHETGHIGARHGAKQLEQALLFAGISELPVLFSKNQTQKEKMQKLQAVSAVIFSIIQLGYSREDETQADELGTQYIYIAGYDPRGMINLLEILHKEEKHNPSALEEFFATHPATWRRIDDVKKEINQRFPNLDQEKPRLIRDTPDFHRIIWTHFHSATNTKTRKVSRQ